MIFKPPKAHFTLFFRGSRDQKFVYWKQSYKVGKTSLSTFGSFENISNSKIQSQSHNAVPETEKNNKMINKMRFFSLEKISFVSNIFAIPTIHTKWQLPNILEFEEVCTVLNFVEIRCNVIRRLHHSERQSSYFRRRVLRPELPDWLFPQKWHKFSNFD